MPLSLTVPVHFLKTGGRGGGVFQHIPRARSGLVALRLSGAPWRCLRSLPMTVQGLPLRQRGPAPLRPLAPRDVVYPWALGPSLAVRQGLWAAILTLRGWHAYFLSLHYLFIYKCLSSFDDHDMFISCTSPVARSRRASSVIHHGACMHARVRAHTDLLQ